MSTPLERQILDDYERRLSESDDMPEALAKKLMELANSERVPSADALIKAIAASVGDQPI